MLKMAPSLLTMPRLLMRRWFSGGKGGKGHVISAFVQQRCSLKTFKTRGRDNQVSVLGYSASRGRHRDQREEVSKATATIPNPTQPGNNPTPAEPQRRYSLSLYLVPLLQLVVRELGVLPQVLQHLWPQLAVLFPHVSGTGL